MPWVRGTPINEKWGDCAMLKTTSDRDRLPSDAARSQRRRIPASSSTPHCRGLAGGQLARRGEFSVAPRLSEDLMPMR